MENDTKRIKDSLLFLESKLNSVNLKISLEVG